MNNFDVRAEFIHEWSLNILILLFGTTTLVQAFIVPTPLHGHHRHGGRSSVGRQAFLRARRPDQQVSSALHASRSAATLSCFAIPMDIRQNYVKRVMGVPGDRIHMVNKWCI